MHQPTTQTWYHASRSRTFLYPANTVLPASLGQIGLSPFCSAAGNSRLQWLRVCVRLEILRAGMLALFDPTGSALTPINLRIVRAAAVWLLLAGWLIVSGCGSAEYEARLQRTQAFYEYLQELDKSLTSPAWSRPDLGLAMRLPLPFKQPQLAPTPEKDDAGNPLPIVNDPRQPHVLGVDLPGIVDAWQGNLTGTAEESQALFYVCTNHQRFIDLGAQTPPPDDFFRDLESTLQNGFGVFVPEGEAQAPADNVKYRVFAPNKSSTHSKYTPSKDYIAIRFMPTQPLGGRNIEGLLFEHKAGNIQIAVLCIFPQEAGSQFRDRLHLALETLVASSTAPRPRSGSAGAPAGSRDPGF